MNPAGRILALQSDHAILIKTSCIICILYFHQTKYYTELNCSRLPPVLRILPISFFDSNNFYPNTNECLFVIYAIFQTFYIFQWDFLQELSFGLYCFFPLSQLKKEKNSVKTHLSMGSRGRDLRYSIMFRKAQQRRVTVLQIQFLSSLRTTNTVLEICWDRNSLQPKTCKVKFHPFCRHFFQLFIFSNSIFLQALSFDPYTFLSFLP